MLTAAELAAIKARAEAATPGPVAVYDVNDGDHIAPLWAVANAAFWAEESDEDAFNVVVYCGVKEDAEFIAAAQTDVRALLAHADALEEQGSRLTREIDLLGGEIQRLKAELRRRNHPTVRAVADLVEEMETQFRRAEAAHDAKDEANRRWLEATTSTPTPEQLARRATFAEAIGIAVRGELEAGESE